MAFQLSPGVNFSEIDLTTVVPAVATTDGAFAGVFRWGPVGERVLVDTETQLVARFGKPTNFNAETFFTAANFLSYTNRLYVSRAANYSGATPTITANAVSGNAVFLSPNTSGLVAGMYLTQISDAATVNATGTSVTVASVNATSFTLSKAAGATTNSVSFYFGRPETAYTALAFDSANTSAKAANLVNQIVRNENDYTNKDGNFDTDVLYVAKYPGALGNSLRVSVVDNAGSFYSSLPLANATVNTTIDFTISSNTATIVFTGAANASANTVRSQIALNDYILAGNSSISQQYLLVKM